MRKTSHKIKAEETGTGQKVHGWRKIIQDEDCEEFRVLKVCFLVALYGSHKGSLASFKKSEPPHVHSRSIHNSQGVEATHVSIDG